MLFRWMQLLKWTFGGLTLDCLELVLLDGPDCDASGYLLGLMVKFANNRAYSLT